MRFISTELTGLCHGKPTANGKNRLFHGNSLVKHNRMQMKCRWCLTWNAVCVISIRLAGPGKHQSALCGTEVNNSIVEHQHSSLIRLLDEQCNYMASFNCYEHVGFKWFYSWFNCYNQLCSYTNRKLLKCSTTLLLSLKTTDQVFVHKLAVNSGQINTWFNQISLKLAIEL